MSAGNGKQRATITISKGTRNVTQATKMIQTLASATQSHHESFWAAWVVNIAGRRQDIV